MTPEQSLEIITKVVDLAQKGGLFTINDAVSVKYALDTLTSVIKTPKVEVVETPEQEIIKLPKVKK